MLWLGPFLLLLTQVALGVQPKLKKLSTLDGYYGGRSMVNGFPELQPRTKASIEQCVIDSFLVDEFSCNNNPYAGLLRLAFHDCATFDSQNASYPGGCNAWASKKCTVFDQCEYTNPDNNGLQPWFDALDAMYENAKIEGTRVSTLMSRADFWHLAVHRALNKASDFQLVNLTYFAGRKDVDQLYSDLSWGPRFPGRHPQAFAFSEMERVCSRNGMENFHATALLGGHTLGQAHPEMSGFRGSWDPTPTRFDNFYWKTLQEETWAITHVHAINSQTGLETNKTQYCLGGFNEQSSIQLFADMGQFVPSSLDSHCSIVKVFAPDATCAKRDPPVFTHIGTRPVDATRVLKAWATKESTFFSAFVGAFNLLSRWGCDDGQCPPVNPFNGTVNCRSFYKHKCKPIFKKVPPPWAFPLFPDGDKVDPNNAVPFPPGVDSTPLPTSTTTVVPDIASAPGLKDAQPITTPSPVDTPSQGGEDNYLTDQDILNIQNALPSASPPPPANP